MSSNGIKCGNRKAHGQDTTYHATTAAVRDCFGASPMQQARHQAAHATTAPVAPPVHVGPATEGMHKVGDQIFKVQKAVHGSGHLYAKRLVAPEEFGGKATFEYAPGVLKTLSSATKMSLEEAKAFGALYGTCCVCGRTLTNETSIENGIGPVCAGKGEWA